MLKTIQRRVFVSVSLAAFLSVMLVTSVLMFSQRHTVSTALIHTAVGAAMLLFAFWHLANFAPLKQYFRARRLWASIAVVAAIGLLLASYLPVKPLYQFYLWGSTLRAMGSSEDRTLIRYVQLDFNPDGAEGLALRMDLRAGPHMAYPQYAFWLETLEGAFIQPLYVTQSVAKSQFDNKAILQEDVVLTSNPFDGNAHEGESLFSFISEPRTSSSRFRRESLPVFLHKSGAIRSDSESVDLSTIDGYSGATLNDSFLLDTVSPLEVSRRYRLRLEINQSFDFNEYYSSDRFSEDPVYSGNGYSAQPSLIYEAIIDAGSKQTYYPMTLIGHGHHSGQNGEVYPDLSHITTARSIVDRIIIELRRETTGPES